MRYSVLPGGTVVSPTAIRLMRCAAVRYRSSSIGDVVSDVAMLSKPNCAPSLGSSSLTLTSSASRSRIALPYSVRFRRCTTKRPGVLLPAHAWSSELVSHALNATYSGSAGCRVPGGGIARTDSLRTTRSHVAAFASTSSTLADSRLTGSSAGFLTRLLWQPTQF